MLRYSVRVKRGKMSPLLPLGLKVPGSRFFIILVLSKGKRHDAALGLL